MNPTLKDELNRLKGNEYFSTILPTIEEYVNRYGPIRSLDRISEIMRKSESLVEALLDRKVKSGKLRDKSQARKSVAGNLFQSTVLYLLIRNVEKGNLPSHLLILKRKSHPIVQKFAVVRVGDEEQKPDMDLMVFSERDVKPVIIYSCKTSLRERAGQTYRWKLLVEVSQHCPTLVEKYGIEYSPKRKVLVGLITADFYGELRSPQQRGALKFFDFTYVGKPGPHAPPLKPLSTIVDDLKGTYGS